MSNEPLVVIRPSTLATLLAGALLGAAVTLSGSAVAGGVSGAPEAGSWKCYVNDRFPDPDEAADWRGAIKMSGGLNAVAANAPAGTVITAGYPTSNSARDISITCVKS